MLSDSLRQKYREQIEATKAAGADDILQMLAQKGGHEWRCREDCYCGWDEMKFELNKAGYVRK